jgi:hypothetical protein
VDPFDDPGVPASCSNAQLLASARSDETAAEEGTFDGALVPPGLGGATGWSGLVEVTGPPELGAGTGTPELGGGVTGVLVPGELLPVAAKGVAAGPDDPQPVARIDSAATDAIANQRATSWRMGERFLCKTNFSYWGYTRFICSCRGPQYVLAGPNSEAPDRFSREDEQPTAARLFSVVRAHEEQEPA